MTKAAATGCQVIRMDYQSGAGTAFASAYAAAVAAGMQVLPIIMIRATSSVATVQSWAADVLSRYPNVRKIELGNETNGSSQYGVANAAAVSASDYATKAKAASTIIRAGNPDILLCAAGVSQGGGLTGSASTVGGPVYIQQIIDQGIAPYVDAFAVHCYGTFGWGSFLSACRQKLVDNGLSTYDIWVTEWGAATNFGSVFTGGVTEAEQANEVTTRFSYFTGQAWLGDTHFYSNMDHNTTAGTSDEEHYGLYYTDGTAKPAVAAYQNAIGAAGGGGSPSGGTLTVSGNEITDSTRTVGVEGDGDLGGITLGGSNLTVSGNEITDATRAVNTQGDGL